MTVWPTGNPGFTEQAGCGEARRSARRMFFISGQVAVGRDAVHGLALNVEGGMGDRLVKGR